MIKNVFVILSFLLIFYKIVFGNESSEQDVINMKTNFSNIVTDAILKFSSFFRKFDVPYLGTENAVFYTREIAKAIAFAPLFNQEGSIEEYVMEHLIPLTLPSSGKYCEEKMCIVSNISQIISNASIDYRFVSISNTNQVMAMKANSLAGNVLWRLSRLPDPNMDILLQLNNTSEVVTRRFVKFVRILSEGIYKSRYVSSFCENGGLNIKNSWIISSTVCGSRYLGFNLNLIPEVSTHMKNSHSSAKLSYLPNINSTIDLMVIPSIIAETIGLNMMKQGYFQDNVNLEDIAHDILRLIMVGITTSRMKIHASNLDRNT